MKSIGFHSSFVASLCYFILSIKFNKNSLLFSFFFYNSQILVESPEKIEENQSFSSYFLTAVGVIIYSVNLKHGLGYLHFDRNEIFEDIKNENIAITIILLFFALFSYLQSRVAEMPFHPIFILTWIVFSLGKK